MQEITGEFKSFDHLKLFERTWLPDEPATGTVVAVHGYSEHSGRHLDLARRLAGVGYAVRLFDLRGHGFSEGPRAFVRSFGDYLRDLQQFVERIQNEAPGAPLFLFGHSMGGLIAAQWALEHQSKLRGLILSAAALKVNDHMHPFLQRISGLVAAVAPRLPSIHLDETAISRRPEAVQAYRDDPLVYHGGMPARTGAELLRSTRQIARRFPELTLPLLIMHGSEDRLTDPEGSRRLYEMSRSTDKTLRLYPGLYHELSQEPEREQVMTDLVEWLQAHS